MSDDQLGTDIDLTLVDDVEEVVRKAAYMICDEQPDVPQPANLRDLDSFSMIQVLLELERITNIKLLERIETFDGETFRDLADFIVRLANEDDEEPSGPATDAAQSQRSAL